MAQSLKARLSVQTVNMCSKYLDVISRRSESLKPVMITSELTKGKQNTNHTIMTTATTTTNNNKQYNNEE